MTSSRVAVLAFAMGWLAALLPTSVRAQQQPSAASGAQEPTTLVVLPVLQPPVVDGDLTEWRSDPQVLLDRAEQVVEGHRDSWQGEADASLQLWLSYDANHLYVAGSIQDDVLIARAGSLPGAPADGVELWFRFLAEESDAALTRPDDWRVLLTPLDEQRPWSIVDPQTDGPRAGAPRQGWSSLTGVRVAAQSFGAQGWRFEATIPFHQLPSLRPGQQRLGFGVRLHDRDRDGDGSGDDVQLAWSGPSEAEPNGLGRMEFEGPGPLQRELDERLLTMELLADLQYLLVPLLLVLALVVIMRLWPPSQRRARWLRPSLLTSGVVLFGLGLLVPSIWLDRRDGEQQRQLQQALSMTQQVIDKGLEGTLQPYRGASRDRALMDLLGGNSIVRQRFTTWRFLSQMAGSSFGSPVQELPDEFPVRPYWLPIDKERVETFHFDPPLQGAELYVVVARPQLLSLPFDVESPNPELRLELTYEDAEPVSETVSFGGAFVSGEPLGDPQAEVDWRRVELDGQLRTLSVTLEEGEDVRIVGLTLLKGPGEPDPLYLGTASLDGVLTDLRGAYPRDAGIELGRGASATVPIPTDVEAAQKLWLFYRATYPGVPTANPGAVVGEVVLRFADGVPERRLQLEHQVSMFFELAVHNTRDEPPDGSPAAIAFEWVDESKEKHINMVLPVSDLPAGAQLESIEFRNLADYRIQFRSVVFGSERAAAPQDPPDSPLEKFGSDRRLKPEFQRALVDKAIAIYRDGRLSESTLGPEQRADLLSLPIEAKDHADATDPLVTTLPTGERRAAVYVPLTADGWDGAVLAVIDVDRDRTTVAQNASRTGLALCLVGAPLLLVLLSELLAALANLRIRLMAVLSAAALVPLVVLSIVLAQVLERGHASDQTEGMQTIVRSTMEQLNEQMDRLRGSAATWLGDLTQVLALEIGDAPSGDVAQRFDAARPALQQLLSGQLPPEWRGGSLRLDWNSSADPAGRADDLRTVVAGDVRMAATEAPARLEPGVYVQWGTVVIAVRSEAPVRGGVLALTVARPLGADFLSALAPGQSLMLCDTRGYPLEVAGSRIPQQSVLQYGRLPAVMKKRERALLSSLDRSAPVVDRATSVYGDWISGYAVLRDLQDTPRALLVLTQPNQRATLDLPIGRIPVRAFFFLVAGLLIVLSAFLSFVISRRISRPVELLEHSALSLARGELKTRVPVEERGQLGRVSRAFNRMAADLEGRLFDLQKLNRVMRDLSSQLDANHTLQVLRGFCEQHGAVDRVRIALLEPETGLVELHGGAEIERFDSPAELRFLPRASGPFCLCWPDGKAQQSELLNRLPGVRSVVGLPLLVGGRCRGAVLLLFENAQPGETDLDLLATVAAQAAIALDNAQLYQHAVQDPVTGAYVPDYFRRRTAEEVALAQQRGVPLALVGVGLGDDLGRPQDLRRLAALLRDLGPPGALLCHAGAGRFHWLLPGVDRQKAQQTIERVHAQWRQEQTVSTDDAEARPLVVAVVVFPDEAASSEFLFSAMADQLERRTVSTTLPTEVDDAMVVEGVTATSPAMRGVLRTLRRVAPTDLAVLILGETGSGKEVLTNLVHRWSRRAEGPLVKVNCAALSPALLQSELFGHEKGAFTGADRRKIGKFEQANGGTILLDEVGEIPLDVQVQLLRVLQEREVDRVGGIDPVPIDVRVVAATNRDIERMVEEGRFREDLYYRLQGIVVNVPPLRQRKPEIPALVENFRREVEASGQSRVRAFSTDAMDELFRYDWPGNVRELRNSVHRAMVLAAGEVVERRDVLASLPRGKSVYPLDLTTSMAMPAQQAEQPPQRHRERSGGEGAGSGVPGPDAPAGHSAAAGAGAAKGAGRRPSGVGKPRSGEVGAAQARAGESAATDATAGNGKATDGNVPEVVLPRAAVHDPLAALPERVRLLLERLRERGEISTQEHMAASGVSHRTGLRDLQALVDLGLAERVGSRRGARYRLVIGRPAGGTA